MAVRSYTPIKPVLSDEEDGTFQLLVKTYFPNEGRFPPGGTLSNWLDILEVGDQMDIRGPSGDIEYKVSNLTVVINCRGKVISRSEGNRSTSTTLTSLAAAVELHHSIK
jgi:Oxidoreductase FAD-binding domain